MSPTLLHTHTHTLNKRNRKKTQEMGYWEEGMRASAHYHQLGSSREQSRVAREGGGEWEAAGRKDED